MASPLPMSNPLAGGRDLLFRDLRPLNDDDGDESTLGGSKKLGKSRLDHLGLPVRSMGRQRYKYARTFTIMYDNHEREGDVNAEKQYKLLMDSRKVLDVSIAGLRRLHKVFFASAPNAEQTLVGPRTFRLALAKYGVRDVVLMQRLFTEFCSPYAPDKIDYRQFVRVLASINEEPCEEKVALLFEMCDVDHSGTVSYRELTPIVIAGVPTNEAEAVLEAFSSVWGEIRSSTSGASDSEWSGLGRATGVCKDDLCDACRRLPNVRDFFSAILTRQSPKADDRLHHNFQARLRELEAEVVKESRMMDQLKNEADEAAAQKRRSGRRKSSFPHGDGMSHSASQPELGRGKVAESLGRQSSSMKLPPLDANRRSHAA